MNRKGWRDSIERQQSLRPNFIILTGKSRCIQTENLVPTPMGFGLRTATATAKGHSFFRQLASAARVMADDLVVWLGWERLVLGHEHDLRRRVQAWRALPPRHGI